MKTTRIYFPPSITESGEPQVVEYELEGSDIEEGEMGDLFLHSDRIGLMVAQDEGRAIHMWVGGVASPVIYNALPHGTQVEFLRNPNTEVSEGKPEHVMWNQNF